jgi:hypothetical protein
VTPSKELFHQARREPRSLPLAHLSVEVGHLYSEDILAGAGVLRERFRRVQPWVRAAQEICLAELPAGRTPRISTCFLVDDYFGPSSPPADVLPELLAAAEQSGLRIDYLAREAACAEADGAPLAELVEERIVADPPPRTTGTRPPVTETGWLCNGQRSPAGEPAAAMEHPVRTWAPPAQNVASRHSVFVDVELWNEGARGRVWSCAFLAAVWQLLRLGMLRYRGEAVATPRSWSGPWPERWDDLPPVVQLNPDAAPFSAYRVLSVLPRRFLTTEQAVRTILDQIALDGDVLNQLVERGYREGMPLSRVPGDRIDYVFTG